MAANPLVDEDEHYASSEDSDFSPDNGAVVERESEDSDSDDATEEPEAAKKLDHPPKRKREDVKVDGADGADDADFDSGDEALIERAKKKQKKKRKARQDEGAEEGGEGGLVKTRSMRAAEKIERKQATSSGPVTIDVDALWAQMKSGKAAAPPPDEPAASKPDDEPAADGAAATPTPDDAPHPPGEPTAASDPAASMIRIRRKYNFAGKVHTEEKLVPRDSAEAKLYLESIATSPPTADDDADAAPPRPPPRKAFRSAFEPVLEPLRRRGDLNLGVAARLQARGPGPGAKKLNTVEKSRMDWAGFVDKEGIQDELVSAGKSKGSYAEREGFLARSEARREEDARRARVSALE